MFENGNYRRRKRRPKQILPNIGKSSSTSSSIPLDESSLSSSESNHQSLLISSNHDDEDLVNQHQYERYSFVKNEPSISRPSNETKKRQRSETPELEHQQTKKSKTVSAFSSIDALIAPSKEIKSSDLSVSPCRYNQVNQNINNNNSHPSYLSSLPPQYLSLLTNGFPLHPTYNRPYPNK